MDVNFYSFICFYQFIKKILSLKKIIGPLKRINLASQTMIFIIRKKFFLYSELCFIFHFFRLKIHVIFKLGLFLNKRNQK